MERNRSLLTSLAALGFAMGLLALANPSCTAVTTPGIISPPSGPISPPSGIASPPLDAFTRDRERLQRSLGPTQPPTNPSSGVSSDGGSSSGFNVGDVYQGYEACYIDPNGKTHNITGSSKGGIAPTQYIPRGDNRPWKIDKNAVPFLFFCIGLPDFLK